MSKKIKDKLFELIKTLSKSEKRHFRLYVNRLGINEKSKFVILFDLLEKMRQYNEQKIINTFIIDKKQLSNISVHLYKQLLISLRMSPTNQDIKIQLREQLDFAQILYGRGLYTQSLDLLKKAKKIALDKEEFNIALELVAFEKIIENQYITRNTENQAEKLIDQSQELYKRSNVIHKFTSLSLYLYKIMLQTGYAKNDEEAKQIEIIFKKEIPKIDYNNMTLHEKIWYYRVHLWYELFTQDFVNAYKHAIKCRKLFYDNKELIQQHKVFFIKSNNLLLEVLFILGYQDKFEKVLDEFEENITLKNFTINKNTESLAVVYLYLHKLNFCFIKGDFDKGVYIIPKILYTLKQYDSQIDNYHIMLFYYKIACIYFGVGNYKNCIVYLNKIINNEDVKIGQDLMCFSRILSLVAHYEKGLDNEIEKRIRDTYKFLIKMDELKQVQKEIIHFLKNLDKIYPHQLKQSFIKIYNKLKVYEYSHYEKRTFLYLDILSWLESKIHNKPIVYIIKDKMNRKNRETKRIKKHI